MVHRLVHLLGHQRHLRDHCEHEQPPSIGGAAMNIVDATCENCDAEMRWQTGTPRLCGKCIARLKRLSQATSVPHKERRKTAKEDTFLSPTMRLAAKK